MTEQKQNERILKQQIWSSCAWELRAKIEMVLENKNLLSIMEGGRREKGGGGGEGAF